VGRTRGHGAAALLCQGGGKFQPEAQISLLPERAGRGAQCDRALNTMRERIKGLVEDRTRMLAAVGHDLRTPITRLRLASEFVGDPQLRHQMLRDLDQMNTMVESILIFLREGRSSKKRDQRRCFGIAANGL